MLALHGVLVLVEECAVEVGEAVRVLWEVGGHPVDYDAYSVLVAVVDEVHEVFGRTESACDREVSQRLITPGDIKRMLHHGKELEMCVPELLDMLDEPVSELPVVDEPPIFISCPRTQVNFVNGNWRIKPVFILAHLNPIVVTPPILVNVPHY